MGTNLSHALDLAQRGLRVFPLVERGKTPAFAGWQDAATSDPDILKKWFTGQYRNSNVGVATGRGVMVVDADVKNGGHGLTSLELMEMIGADLSFVVATASGGRHAYFRLPDGAQVPNSVRRLAEYPDIDIRGEGGLVVAPGSVGDNWQYAVVKADAITDAPQWLIEAAQRARKIRDKSSAPDTEPDKPEAIDSARRYLKENAPIAYEGAGGNDTTYQVIAHIRDYGVSEGAALDLLLDNWNDRASPPWGPVELEQVIENVYEYATGPAGGKSAEAEFDPVEIAERQKGVDAAEPPKKQRLYRVDFDTAAAQATAETSPNLIADILDQNSFAVVYGPSNSGKTFLALSLAYHVATGQPWDGHATARGAVLYVVAEGSRGINKRIAALKKHYSPAGRPPLDIIPCPIDMKSSSADVLQIVQLAKESAAAHGMPVVLIVIDTLSRALAGGDENASTDMGAFVMNVDKLRLATSATVLVVHHTGKNVANGARGWSGLRAAIDTEIEVGEGGVISFEKQRDMEMLPDIRFRLAGVNLGPGAGGKDVTSCVLLPVSASEAEFEAQMDIPPLDREFFDCLVALAEHGPVSGRKWENEFEAELREQHAPPANERKMRRMRKTLKEAGWVRQVGNSHFEPVILEVQEQ